MEIRMERVSGTKMIRKNRKRHGLMITACAFLCTKIGNGMSILLAISRRIDTADFADNTFWQSKGFPDNLFRDQNGVFPGNTLRERTLQTSNAVRSPEKASHPQKSNRKTTKKCYPQKIATQSGCDILKRKTKRRGML